MHSFFPQNESFKLQQLTFFFRCISSIKFQFEKRYIKNYRLNYKFETIEIVLRFDSNTYAAAYKFIISICNINFFLKFVIEISYFISFYIKVSFVSCIKVKLKIQFDESLRVRVVRPQIDRRKIGLLKIVFSQNK